jgi:hypothetical protein
LNFHMTLYSACAFFLFSPLWWIHAPFSSLKFRALLRYSPLGVPKSGKGLFPDGLCPIVPSKHNCLGLCTPVIRLSVLPGQELITCVDRDATSA